VFRLLRNKIFASDRLLMAARYSPEIVGAGLVPAQAQGDNKSYPYVDGSASRPYPLAPRAMGDSE
jgi:hypothetical protein